DSSSPQRRPELGERCLDRHQDTGLATKCFRPHWSFVLTTPICCCPVWNNGVSTVRERMPASLSVSQEPDQRRMTSVMPQQLRFIAWNRSLSSFSPVMPPIHCKRDNNLTWLHLHRQKCHIIILI
ncbi:hypothetical protein GOODEAATRI_033556, partial [Goodea atripinnis]